MERLSKHWASAPGDCALHIAGVLCALFGSDDHDATPHSPPARAGTVPPSPRQNRFNREQDAAFVYRNGIHVSKRQHVEKLSGANAGARGGPIVEERDLFCGTQFSNHFDDIRNVRVHGNGFLLPDDAADIGQTTRPWAASGFGSELGSGNGWSGSDTSSHVAQRRSWQVITRSPCAVYIYIYIYKYICMCVYVCVCVCVCSKSECVIYWSLNISVSMALV
jgi:hypothetical protein